MQMQQTIVPVSAGEGLDCRPETAGVVGVEFPFLDQFEM